VSQGITRIIQVSSLIAAAGVRGALRGNSTIGLFEVDEATVPLVVEAIGATDIVVTNLFRDQLDRFGEVDAIATTVGKAIQRTNARVYLNADDPTVASLSRFVGPGRLVYFGLESPAAGVAALKTAVDSVHCPRCDATLRFSRTFYSHLGHYECPRGDFPGRERPWRFPASNAPMPAEAPSLCRCPGIVTEPKCLVLTWPAATCAALRP